VTAKDAVMPLSVAFFDQAGSLVHAAELPPCPPGSAECPAVAPPVPVSYALEAEQGSLAPLGVVLGSRLEVRGPCPPP
jgi:uncharacterized membrane protein (UPF0127 family)